MTACEMFHQKLDHKIFIKRDKKAPKNCINAGIGGNFVLLKKEPNRFLNQLFLFAKIMPQRKAVQEKHGKAAQGRWLSSKPRRLSAWSTRPSGDAAAREPEFSGALKKAFEGL